MVYHERNSFLEQIFEPVYVRLFERFIWVEAHFVIAVMNIFEPQVPILDEVFDVVSVAHLTKVPQEAGFVCKDVVAVCKQVHAVS